MFKNLRRIGISIAIVLTLSVIIFMVSRKYVFMMKDMSDYSGSIGIIDFAPARNHSIITESNIRDINIACSEDSHGDMILEFLEDLDVSNDIYFFGADIDGRITDDNIIEGLEWMNSKGVKRINISLSSKNYAEIIDKWIMDHPDVKVFASYNNKINSVADYPAMYKNVVGVGSDNRIEYKDIDRAFSSYDIILFSSSIKKYSGNSFLSVIAMLED